MRMTVSAGSTPKALNVAQMTAFGILWVIRFFWMDKAFHLDHHVGRQHSAVGQLDSGDVCVSVKAHDPDAQMEPDALGLVFPEPDADAPPCRNAIDRRECRSSRRSW